MAVGLPRTLALTIVAAALACGQPRGAAAPGTGPAFDCTTATRTTEHFICGDAALAALNHKLDGVYKAVLAKVRDGGSGGRGRPERRVHSAQTRGGYVEAARVRAVAAHSG